ncbi:Ubiquitin-conjugating enzyme E2 T [Dispira parvispora]|uniref:Ubiquitin-conjugating enzyme E2 T n=1 Tax=Dispira parvispora TaxID=1520584 RepID=A0A9W8E9H3_9FUNG|nr:Ubiquitin-conjugating enzyme E2 T [Dispira parvispora]
MSNQSGPLLRRMKRELERLSHDPLPGIICYPQGDSLVKWTAFVKGPADTPYECGNFELRISIPDRKNMPRFTQDATQEPNPDDPLLADVAAEFLEHHSIFLEKARQWTQRHATERKTERAEAQLAVDEKKPTTSVVDSPPPSTNSPKPIVSPTSKQKSSTGSPLKRNFIAVRKLHDEQPILSPNKNESPSNLISQTPPVGSHPNRRGASRTLKSGKDLSSSISGTSLDKVKGDKKAQPSSPCTASADPVCAKEALGSMKTLGKRAFGSTLSSQQSDSAPIKPSLTNEQTTLTPSPPTPHSILSGLPTQQSTQSCPSSSARCPRTLQRSQSYDYSTLAETVFANIPESVPSSIRGKRRLLKRGDGLAKKDKGK